MTPQQFAKTWSRIQLKETAAAQPQFYDVCQLVGHCNLDPSQFTDFQRKLLTSQEEISRIYTVEGMQEYVGRNYRDLRRERVTHIRDYEEEIAKIERLRLNPYNPRFEKEMKKAQEMLEFWHSFEE